LTQAGVFTALRVLKSTLLPIGAAVADLPWWIVVVAIALTVFLYGAEPAMRWLDVLDRLRHRTPWPPLEASQATPPPEPLSEPDSVDGAFDPESTAAPPVPGRHSTSAG
jgi:hypothetical protein